MLNVFCEKCGIRMTENGNYCSACSTKTKRTLSWWARLSIPKKIVLGFAVGFVAYQVLAFVIGFFIGLTDTING